MVGRNPGYVTTAGERLADGLRALGHDVLCVSESPNRYVRLAEITATLARVRRRIDAIALMVFGGPSFVVEDVASYIGAGARVPIVMVMRGGDMPAFMSRFPAWSRRVLNRATRIVAPSNYLARSLEDLGWTVEVVPNPIRLGDYPFRVRRALRPRLLWMRAFHPVYHPEMAIRAFALIRSRFPDATLAMGGQDKGLERSVQNLARDLGVADSVRFPGFLDMAAKRAEGDGADVFINTNRVDNQPVSVIEACAMGLPVVATNVGGIPDLLRDRETGLLVRDGDHAAMAEAVIDLLEDPELAERLSRQGREVAEASADDVIFRRWESLLRSVTSTNGDRPCAG